MSMTKQAYFTKIRRYRMKLEAVKRLGGKCIKCGWVGNLAGFHFHHRNPEEKEFTIGGNSTTNWEKFWNEVQKCDLFCSICHDIFHSDYSDPQFLEDVEKYKGRELESSDIPWKNQTKIPVIRKIFCGWCEKEFIAPNKNSKFCNEKCRNFSMRKVDRPSKEELKNLTETMSLVKIGEKFGVSDNAIRKWIKNYE